MKVRQLLPYAALTLVVAQLLLLVVSVVTLQFLLPVLSVEQKYPKKCTMIHQLWLLLNSNAQIVAIHGLKGSTNKLLILV